MKTAPVGDVDAADRPANSTVKARRAGRALPAGGTSSGRREWAVVMCGYPVMAIDSVEQSYAAPRNPF